MSVVLINRLNQWFSQTTAYQPEYIIQAYSKSTLIMCCFLPLTHWNDGIKHHSELESMSAFFLCLYITVKLMGCSPILGVLPDAYKQDFKKTKMWATMATDRQANYAELKYVF
jgi:hypothetical protein